MCQDFFADVRDLIKNLGEEYSLAESRQASYPIECYIEFSNSHLKLVIYKEFNGVLAFNVKRISKGLGKKHPTHVLGKLMQRIYPDQYGQMDIYLYIKNKNKKLIKERLQMYFDFLQKDHPEIMRGDFTVFREADRLT